MDSKFAQGILKKYGWREGKGLGKNETGIAKALKPKLKFDTAGVGHKIDLTSQWWSKSFDKAAKSLKVLVSEDSVRVEKQLQMEKQLPKEAYTGFIKAGTQTGSCFLEAEANGEILNQSEDDNTSTERIFDEKLFEACGGLTAHKAARQGLKMTGKLKRLQEQEAQLLINNNLLHQELSRKKRRTSTDNPRIVVDQPVESICEALEHPKRRKKRIVHRS